MKKMNAEEMRHVNGGIAWWLALGAWLFGRYLVCGTKGFGKC